jgi:hypothetical protein
MQTEIGVINNPGSKLNRQERFMYRLSDMFPEGPFPIVHTMPKGMCYERCLRYLVEDREVGVLAINSGDGGAHKILTQMIELYGKDAPPVLVIPGGTINVLSQAVGHRRWGSFDRVWCLRELLEGREYDIQEKNLVAVEDSEGIHYGFIYASGVVTEFYKLYERRRDKDFWYAVDTLNRVLLSFLPGINLVPKEMFDFYDYRLDLDGETSEQKLRGIVVYGIGIDILNMSLPHTSGLHTLGGTLSPLQLAENLPRVLADKQWVPKIMKDFFFGELDFELDCVVDEMVVNGPGGYVLDGELYKDEPEVRLSPWAVKFVNF